MCLCMCVLSVSSGVYLKAHHLVGYLPVLLPCCQGDLQHAIAAVQVQHEVQNDDGF